MKKLVVIGCALGLFYRADAQKISIGKVPLVVKETFKKLHPSASPKWEWEDKAYEANFKEDGRNSSCTITKEGTLKETETAMRLGELPEAAQNYIAKNYHRKKLKEVAKIVTADGTVSYEVETGGKELLFDAAGNFKEEKKD